MKNFVPNCSFSLYFFIWRHNFSNLEFFFLSFFSFKIYCIIIKLDLADPNLRSSSTIETTSNEKKTRTSIWLSSANSSSRMILSFRTKSGKMPKQQKCSRKNYIYSVLGRNSRAEPLIQYLSFVSVGPSLNLCPKWAPQSEQLVSVSFTPCCARSMVSFMLSSRALEYSQSL